MTSKTQYRLHLLLGLTGETPMAGVPYSIMMNGKILSKGTTSSTGETAIFEVVGSVLIKLQVFNPKMRQGKGGYIAPILYEHDSSSILLNNKTLDAMNQIQTRKLKFGEEKGILNQHIMLQPKSKPQVVTLTLRLKPYVFVELFDHLKRAFKTRLNYDVLDTNNNVIKVNNKELKGLKTQRAGLTELVLVDQLVKFRFYGGDLGNVKVLTGLVHPFYSHQEVVKIQYVRTSPAITTQNISNTTILAGKENIPIVVDPVTKEIYVLSKQDFKDFIEVSSSLSNAMKHLHERRTKLNTIMGLEAKTPEQIREAEKNLGIAQDEAIKTLNGQFKNQADIREVIAFEMFTTADGHKKLNAVRKYTNASQHIKNKNNRLNKFEYSLKYQVPWSVSENTAKTEHKDGTLMTIDRAKFKENFTKTVTDINGELYKTKGETSVTLVPDPKLFGITATELVESYQTSDSSTVDVQAQWLRLIASTGYDGTVKWGTQGFQAKGSAYTQAKMVLFEGKKKWLWAYPSLQGWVMQVDNVPLGAIRFICGAEIYGFSGAVFSASAAFAVTASTDGTKQMLTSVKRDPKATLANSLNASKQAILNIQKGEMDDKASDDNKFNAGINAFAGIQANITPFGGLQWLDPEHPKDFSDLAKISPTLGLSAGVGASANFELYYANGAFRFRASIAACYGVGGKGALEFTVDFSKIDQLIKFIAYQLTYISFKRLVYMLHDDFILLHKISMMLPFEKDNAFLKSVTLINLHFSNFTSKMKIAEQRIAMCRKINAKGQWLKYLSPESRGCFLYHITRHGFLTQINDPAETEGWRFLGTDKVYDLPEHKEAVLNLFRSVTVVSHWTNTLQHMSTDGEISNKSIAENESELLNFLNLGGSMGGILPLANLSEIKKLINQDHNFPSDYSSGNKYIDEYIKMRGERILAYPKNYMIASFNTQEFRQAQLAQGIEQPDVFLAQAPQSVDQLDMDHYSVSDDKTWMV